MSDFYYVYTLESEKLAGRFYVGVTGNLAERLRGDNAGRVSHTAKFGPWPIKTAVALRDQARAFAFERYPKTASGHAFARKHL